MGICSPCTTTNQPAVYQKTISTSNTVQKQMKTMEQMQAEKQLQKQKAIEEQNAKLAAANQTVTNTNNASNYDPFLYNNVGNYNYFTCAAAVTCGGVTGCGAGGCGGGGCGGGGCGGGGCGGGGCGGGCGG